MRLELIRLLAVVVALVVPLQGMTAVMAGQCMALGHHEPAAGHDAHGHAQDGHDHAAHSHDPDSAADDDAAGAHCGPCTACCASAFIGGPAPLSLAPSCASSPYVFSQFPPLGVQPDGPDRPPLAL